MTARPNKDTAPGDAGLTHMDAAGRARMVDVGGKPATERGAVATGRVRVGSALAEAIRGDSVAKGNLLEVARLAGIQAAKRTAELIPLCHPLGLDHVDVDVALGDDGIIAIKASARVTGRTGVEMEALTAVAVAALTVVDMGKAIDKGIVIESIRLDEKWGGRSGHYRASDQSPAGDGS